MFDLSTYIGHWPFRKLENATLDGVSALLEKNSVGRAAVTNINALFYRDTMEGNLELIEALSEYKGSITFEPFAVINPTYPSWQDDLKECIKLGFRGVEVAPFYHGYRLDSPDAAELYRLCGENSLVFKIVAGYDEIRGRHPFDSFDEPSGDEIASLISTFDKTPTVIVGYYNYYLGEKLREATLSRSNVILDISRLDVFNNPTFTDSIRYVGAERLCFASMCPFRLIAPQNVKLTSGVLTDAEIPLVAEKNAERLFS